MKQAEAVTILYEANNNRIYTIEDGLQVWDVRIDIGLNEKITLGHLSDIHYNLCIF